MGSNGKLKVTQEAIKVLLESSAPDDGEVVTVAVPPPPQGQPCWRGDDGLPEGQLDAAGALQLPALSVWPQPGVGEPRYSISYSHVHQPPRRSPFPES